MSFVRLLALAALSACAKPVVLPPPVPLSPERSGVSAPARVPPLDDRAYRIVRLENGLEAILVSDPDAIETAAALAVSIGSLAEPDGREGLAHFLEHMLFMGTEVYPSVDGFGDHLALHAGESNAWTGDETTLYYFTVDPGGFDEAFHRFSRFFVDPLLARKYVRKERNAVESEYRLNIEDRWSRWFGAYAHTVNPDHPGSRFSVGSLDTLADRPGAPVLDDLRGFYDAYYTADRMHLAVLGKAPLDTLEGQVRAWFAEVPRGTDSAFAVVAPQFRDDQLGVRVDISQNEDENSLYIEWPIPEQRAFWPDEPTALLAHVLGDEGPGSLFAQLSARNWVTSLMAGADGGLSDNGDVFVFDMSLTAEGAAHTDDIIAACFAAIQVLRDEGIPAYLGAESAAVNELQFRFDAPKDAGPLTEWLAEGMVDHPPERALDAWLTRPVTDPAAHRALLDLLSVDRARIIVDGKDLPTDQTDSWYDVGYSMRPLTDAEKARYTAGSDLRIALPKPNPWVPSTTDLHTDAAAPPVLLQSDRPTEVYYAPDASWNTPRTITRLDLRLSPTGFDSNAQTVLSTLLYRLVDQHLVDFRYPVELSGSSFGLHFRPSRFQLTVDSWSDVHLPLTDAILTELRAFAPSEENFDSQKAELLRQWSNRVHDRPIELISDIPFEAIDPEDSSYAESIAILQATTFADLSAFWTQYWRPGALRTLTYGDATEELALSLATQAEAQLSSGAVEMMHDYQQVRWLPPGTERTHERSLDHDDSAITMMWLGEPGNAASGKWILLAHMLSTPFFDELRTRQQLGYIATAGRFSRVSVPGLYVEIQSSVAGPSVLKDRIDTFLSGWPTHLEKMDPATFQTSRDKLVAAWREPPSTFAERWDEVSDQVSYGAAGARDIELAAAIASVTQDELVALARSLFSTTNPTRIVAWSVGNAHPNDPLKGAADCVDRACLAEGMEVVFTMDYAHPHPSGAVVSP